MDQHKQIVQFESDSCPNASKYENDQSTDVHNSSAISSKRVICTTTNVNGSLQGDYWNLSCDDADRISSINGASGPCFIKYTNLPLEPQRIVFSFLGINDLISMRMVSKYCKKLADFSLGNKRNYVLAIDCSWSLSKIQFVSSMYRKAEYLDLDTSTESRNNTLHNNNAVKNIHEMEIEKTIRSVDTKDEAVSESFNKFNNNASSFLFSSDAERYRESCNNSCGTTIASNCHFGNKTSTCYTIEEYDSSQSSVACSCLRVKTVLHAIRKNNDHIKDIWIRDLLENYGNRESDIVGGNTVTITEKEGRREAESDENTDKMSTTKISKQHGDSHKCGEEIITYLYEHFPHVKTICVHGHISDGILGKILSKFAGNLCDLSLAYFEQEYDRKPLSVNSCSEWRNLILLANCNHLTELQIRHIDAMWLKYLPVKLTTVKKFSFHAASNLSIRTRHFARYINAAIFAQIFPNLSILKLKGHVIINVSAITTQLLQLEHLSLDVDTQELLSKSKQWKREKNKPLFMSTIKSLTIKHPSATSRLICSSGNLTISCLALIGRRPEQVYHDIFAEHCFPLLESLKLVNTEPNSIADMDDAYFLDTVIFPVTVCSISRRCILTELRREAELRASNTSAFEHMFLRIVSFILTSITYRKTSKNKRLLRLLFTGSDTVLSRLNRDQQEKMVKYLWNDFYSTKARSDLEEALWPSSCISLQNESSALSTNIPSGSADSVSVRIKKSSVSMPGTSSGRSSRSCTSCSLKSSSGSSSNSLIKNACRSGSRNSPPISTSFLSGSSSNSCSTASSSSYCTKRSLLNTSSKQSTCSPSDLKEEEVEGKQGNNKNKDDDEETVLSDDETQTDSEQVCLLINVSNNYGDIRWGNQAHVFVFDVLRALYQKCISCTSFEKFAVNIASNEVGTENIIFHQKYTDDMTDVSECDSCENRGYTSLKALYKDVYSDENNNWYSETEENLIDFAMFKVERGIQKEYNRDSKSTSVSNFRSHFIRSKEGKEYIKDLDDGNKGNGQNVDDGFTRCIIACGSFPDLFNKTYFKEYYTNSYSQIHNETGLVYSIREATSRTPTNTDKERNNCCCKFNSCRRCSGYSDDCDAKNVQIDNMSNLEKCRVALFARLFNCIYVKTNVVNAPDNNVSYVIYLKRSDHITL